MIRIIVVDDQHLMRDGLVSLIQRESDFQVIGEASNGKEAVDLILSARPDIVLMDIRMPHMNGILATIEIMKHYPACRVLMLTTFDDDDYVVEAIRAGAMGYILKDILPQELAHTIRQVVQGTYVFNEQIGAKLAKLLQTEKRSNQPTTRMPSTLTEREIEIVLLVAQGFSNREIAQKLFISEGTVKNHISSILAQLHLRDRSQLIVLAYENRWVKSSS
jgi:DNA-binding NarL/FixJ family response regulator